MFFAFLILVLMHSGSKSRSKFKKGSDGLATTDDLIGS